ncbi:YmjE family protein, partial [Escherichia sp. R-CC3]
MNSHNCCLPCVNRFDFRSTRPQTL